MALRLALLLLVAVSVCNGIGTPKKILKSMGLHYIREQCWGKQEMKNWYQGLKNALEKCQELSPNFPIELFDNNNQAVALGPTPINNPKFQDQYEAWKAFLNSQQPESRMRSGLFSRRARASFSSDDLAEFGSDVEDYKMMKKDVIGNITCALSEFGVLDANLNINIDFYLNRGWEQYAPRAESEFKAKLSEGFQACYDVSQSLPQSVLNKSPIYAKFGRQLIFLKCAQKIEIGICVKKNLIDLMEEEYGPLTPQVLSQLGLPTDRYQAVLLAKTIKMKTMSEGAKAVWKVMLGKGGSDD